MSVCTPPSSTITSASTERGTPSTSGEMEPFEKAYIDPAMPANAPATAKAIHCVRGTSMPIASARSGESREARRVKPKGASSMRQRSAMAPAQMMSAR